MDFDFEYLGVTADNLKSLIRDCYIKLNVTPDLEKITCNGVKWDSPESPFYQALDIPIRQYRKQLELLISNYNTSISSFNVEVYKLVQNFQMDKRGKEKLELLFELMTGERRQLDLSKITKKDINEAIHKNITTSHKHKELKRSFALKR